MTHRPEPQREGVSVVIATYGRDEVLLETIRLVLEQDPAPVELLVIDQTPFHSPAVERELARLSATGAIGWIRLRKASIPCAMNAGLLQARAEIVLFLDDDVIPGPGLMPLTTGRIAHRGRRGLGASAAARRGAEAGPPCARSGSTPANAGG